MPSTGRVGCSLALAAAWLLAACSAPRLDPSRTHDACAYLTRAEAESVLAAPAHPGQRSAEGPFDVCTYASRDQPRRRAVLRWYVAARDPRATTGPLRFAAFRRELEQAVPVTPIADFGDTAFWIASPVPDPWDQGTLWVRRGEYFFQVTAGEVPGHVPWKMARELARDVLRKLPEDLPAGISPAAVAACCGLLGRYYPNPRWRGEPALVRVDPEIDFAWRDLAPLGTPRHSVEWSGRLRVEAAGEYGLRLLSDDGAFLYLDGELVIDNGGEHMPVSVSAQLSLHAGEHDIALRYFNSAYTGEVRLFWTPPGGEETLIPPAALRPAEVSTAAPRR